MQAHNSRRPKGGLNGEEGPKLPLPGFEEPYSRRKEEDSRGEKGKKNLKRDLEEDQLSEGMITPTRRFFLGVLSDGGEELGKNTTR